MPALPAPYPFLPSGGELPVSSTDDVLAVFPAPVRDVESAPVRDAIAEAETTMFVSFQERTDYAAAQSDASRATGVYLQGQASDRLIYAQENEDDEALRDRIFKVPDVVTPPSILAAANAILAPYTSTSVQIFEANTDGLFIEDGTAVWHSFITDGTVDIDPEYPARRYALRPGSHPGDAWVFADQNGRYFVMRVPDISGATGNVAFVFDGTQSAESGLGAWIDDGADPDGSSSSFIYDGIDAAINVYQAIVNTVERLRGHGVRWMLYVDNRL